MLNWYCLLQTGLIGAPRRNIIHLTQIGYNVTYREATLTILAEDYLQKGEPVIAFVDTGELSYWSRITNHAVVIVGLDEENVLVLDPVFSATVRPIPQDEFQLPWLNGDYACGVIHKK